MTKPSQGKTRPTPLDEAAFLATYDPTAFERPSVTVDVVLLAPFDGHLHTLLIRRPDHPFKGKWALPGGFIQMNESLEEAAARVLRAKTGLDQVFLEQLATFGSVHRDPRTRILSVAYFALVDPGRFQEVAVPSEDAVVAKILVPWAGSEGGPVGVKGNSGQRLQLAFDHSEIIGRAVQRIRGKLDYSPVGFEFLAETFTLLDLQKVHETVLGRRLNKDSFRKRMLASGQLEPTGEIQQGVVHRPAALYRFLR